MTKRGKGFGPPLNNISKRIGITPIVKISDCISPEGKTIYAQCEFFNLLSLVKDHLALSISRQQERRLSEAMPDGCQGCVWKHWHRPEICNDLKEAGKYIKEHSPGTKIILAEPGASNLIGSGINGWTPDFISLVLEKELDQCIQGEMFDIPNGVAIQTSLALAKNEGILTGISGGAKMWAAVKTAKNSPEGSVIVAMLPDTDERYLSTPLFSENFKEMNEGKSEIARSTPSWILER
ncbi:hypothetical protein ACHAWX_004589 [Stephanocyclus meneghinianus]